MAHVPLATSVCTSIPISPCIPRQDEAYELGKGPYGSEACSTIVAAMTDPKYEALVIIMAGYQADISSMLDTNPGLKSRFQHFLEFPDWAPEDCADLFAAKACATNYAFDVKGE
eukprot:1269898-Prymnesium_polylepis.1